MENYVIRTCQTCGSYLIPHIRYQYGVAWTEYYCETCGQKLNNKQLIYTTTTGDLDEVKRKVPKSFKSRLITKDVEHE
jgi:hypothetical protein